MNREDLRYNTTFNHDIPTCTLWYKCVVTTPCNANAIQTVTVYILRSRNVLFPMRCVRDADAVPDTVGVHVGASISVDEPLASIAP
jgi:hypothetical protein